MPCTGKASVLHFWQFWNHLKYTMEAYLSREDDYAVVFLEKEAFTGVLRIMQSSLLLGSRAIIFQSILAALVTLAIMIQRARSQHQTLQIA